MTTEEARPLVSVIMPVRNRQDYIAEAAGSILRQTERDLELIVVDDRSTDDSVAVVQALGDDRVRVVGSVGHGVASARNTGLDAARGRFIAWHDSDDVALPHRLQSLLTAVADGAGFSHSDMLVVDEKLLPIVYARVQTLPPSRVLAYILRFGTPYNNPSTLVRREAIGAHRFDESMSIGEDTDFLRRIAPFHVGIHVPEPLVLYRRHEEQLTRTLTPEMLVDEIAHLLSEGLHRLVPEAFRAFGETPEGESVAHGLIGFHLARRGLRDAATSSFKRAVAVPDSDAARPLLNGMLKLLEGDGVSALLALAGAPRSAVSLYLNAVAQRQLGNPRTAVELCRGALDLDPDSFDALLGLNG